MVYGFASIIDAGDGVPIEDAQGDVILEDDLVEAAHGFMKNHRALGHRHTKIEGVGDIVESLVITKDVRKALGLPDNSPLGWFIGCKVTDADVWARVESGELRAFSIGGSGEREEMAAATSSLRKALIAKRGWTAAARAAALMARRSNKLVNRNKPARDERNKASAQIKRAVQDVTARFGHANTRRGGRDLDHIAALNSLKAMWRADAKMDYKAVRRHARDARQAAASQATPRRKLSARQMGWVG